MCGWFRQVAARGREGGSGRGMSAAVSYAGGRDGPEERDAASAGRERVAGIGEAAGASVAGKSRCPAERRLPGPLWGVCNGYMLQRFRLPLA